MDFTGDMVEDESMFSVTDEDQKNDDGMDVVDVEVKSYWKTDHFLHKKRSKSRIIELKG